MLALTLLVLLLELVLAGPMLGGLYVIYIIIIIIIIIISVFIVIVCICVVIDAGRIVSCIGWHGSSEATCGRAAEAFNISCTNTNNYMHI